MNKSNIALNALMESLIVQQGLVLLAETMQEASFGPNHFTISLVYRPNIPWIDWPPYISLDPSNGIWRDPGEYAQYGRAYIAIAVENRRGAALHLMQVEDINAVFIPVAAAIQGKLHEHLFITRTSEVRKLSTDVFACYKMDDSTGELIVRPEKQTEYDTLTKDHEACIRRKYEALLDSSAQYVILQDCYLAINGENLPERISSSLLEFTVVPSKYAEGTMWRLGITNSTVRIVDGILQGNPRHSRFDGVSAELSLHNAYILMCMCKGISESWMNGTIPRQLGVTPLDYRSLLDEILAADLASEI